MAYSIEDAFSDSALALQSDDPEATRRLELFIDSITADQIKKSYLSLAKLFWKMPREQSVRLAHVVIVDYLFEIEAWSDIYLWSFSTLRQIPMQDTVWITRNYFAASLQALGQSERAQEVLRENWMSKQSGSGSAYEWLSGWDLNESISRALDVAEGKEPKEEVNEFLELRATWLDDDKVASVMAWAATVVAEGGKGLEPSANLEEKNPSALFLAAIDSTQGLTSWVLETCDQLDAKDRNNALLGITHAVIAYLRLDDSDFLVEEAAKAEMRGDDASVAVDFLSIAALLMNEDAYVPLAKTLRNIGLVEQAIGYANVAVWKNLPGSADVLSSLLGLDGVAVDFEDVDVSEAAKVDLDRMASKPKSWGGSRPEATLQSLGINISPPKIRVSDTLGWEGFTITDFVSKRNRDEFYKAQRELVQIEETRGLGYANAAWHELAEAGHSRAWHVLSADAWYIGDSVSATQFFRLAVHCAWDQWDVLVAAVTQMEYLNLRVIEHAQKTSEGVSSIVVEARHLKKDIAEVSALIRNVTESVYPDSKTLKDWLREDEADTRAWLTRAGYVMNLHLAIDLEGSWKTFGSPGAVAWGLLLRLEFGTPEQQAEAERTLRHMASVDTLNSVALSGYKPIQKKMAELGLAWWI